MSLGATCGLYFITDPDKRIEIEITHLQVSCDGGVLSVRIIVTINWKRLMANKKKSILRSEMNERFAYWIVDSGRLGNERRIFPIAARSSLATGREDHLGLWKWPAQEPLHLVSKRCSGSVPRAQTRRRIFHQCPLCQESQRSVPIISN